MLPNHPLTLTKDDIRKMKINRASGAARNAILCLLAHAKPKHFVTGADISLAKDHFSEFKDPNAHHIFPKNFIKKALKRYVEEVHLLPNFCFLPADLNNKIKDRPPSDYFVEFRGSDTDNPNFAAALRSHLIPSGADSPIWNDDYDSFLQQRAELIWAAILTAVGDGDIYDSGAAVPRDQARLAVDEIEVKLRRVLHDVLRSHLGEDYWKSAVPGDLQAKIKERISERNRSKIVARIEDPLIRLQYADIMDLHKIVDKNWDLFKERFESREALKSHFLALKNYRNPLGHVRDVDVVEQKQGEAAIIWFRRAVSTPVIQASPPMSNKRQLRRRKPRIPGNRPSPRSMSSGKPIGHHSETKGRSSSKKLELKIIFNKSAGRVQNSPHIPHFRLYSAR